MHETLALIAQAQEWERNGQRLAIATVVQTWGSSPRRPGAQMLISEDLLVAGSVSAGCVESAVIHAAGEVIASQQAQLLHFGIADEDALHVGLACGGEITLFVQPWKAPLYRAIQQTLQDEESCTLLTILGGSSEWIGAQHLLRQGETLYTDLSPTLLDAFSTVLQTPLGAPQRSTLTNANVLANADALTTTDANQRSTRTNTDAIATTDALANADAIAATDALTNADAIATTDAPILDYFLMHIQPAPQLILIGGNHIAVALAQLAHVMGYRLVVIDPRSIFATPERFPQVEKVYAAWPQEILPQLHLTEQTAFVLLTHDPKIDDIALEFALHSRSGYIGALGSRRTHAKRLERLAERGISSEQLQRIFGPIGLAIGAETPEQIALSILSEIVLHQKRPPMAPRLPLPPSLKDQPAPRT